MKLAIIPARGGSKRIPGKNIKRFAGRPIIAYSIEAARQVEVFDRIIVSTDSQEIAEVARQYGAEAPFVRPTELADDFTPTADVLLHALDWHAHNGTPVEHCCCIYATAPFVGSRYLRQGYEILRQTGAGAVFSVTTYPASIYRALRIDAAGRLAMVWPENELTRSNDLPETYHDAGQFYWLNCRRFLSEKKIYSHDARPVILPRHLVQDIDTVEDWAVAEAMYEALRLMGRLEEKNEQIHGGT